MQSGSKMKRYDEYDFDEPVMEESVCAGTVRAMALHPHRRTMGYLLVCNSNGEYTILGCLTDAKSGLSLTRRIPIEVMRVFVKAIQDDNGSTPAPLRSHHVKKYPVLARDAPSEEASPEPDEMPRHPLPVPATQPPYFDFA